MRQIIYSVIVIVLMVMAIQFLWPVIVVLILGGIIIGVVNYYKLKNTMSGYQEKAQRETYQDQPYRKTPASDVIDVEYTEKVDYESDEWS